MPSDGTKARTRSNSIVKYKKLLWYKGAATRLHRVACTQQRAYRQATLYSGGLVYPVLLCCDHIDRKATLFSNQKGNVNPTIYLFLWRNIIQKIILLRLRISLIFIINCYYYLFSDASVSLIFIPPEVRNTTTLFHFRFLDYSLCAVKVGVFSWFSCG